MSTSPFHIAVVLAPFLAIPLVFWASHQRRVRAWLPALIPGLLTVWFASAFVAVRNGGPFSIAMEWAPALRLSLSFRFDGLSTLFATLIAIGPLVRTVTQKPTGAERRTSIGLADFPT